MREASTALLAAHSATPTSGIRLLLVFVFDENGD